MKGAAEVVSEHDQRFVHMSPQKQAVLEVAQAMFMQRGYEGLSIRDLAEACGLAKATIYHHFRDKEDLLFCVIEHQLYTQRAHLMEVANGDLPPQAKLRAALDVYYQLLYEKRAGVMWSISAYAQLKERLRIFLQSQLAVSLEPWMRILEEGIAEGVFRPLDVQRSAFSLLALLNASALYQTGLGMADAGERPSGYVFDFVTRGILRE